MAMLGGFFLVRKRSVQGLSPPLLFAVQLWLLPCIAGTVRVVLGVWAMSTVLVVGWGEPGMGIIYELVWFELLVFRFFFWLALLDRELE